MTYEVKLHPEARKDLRKLDNALRQIVIKKMKKLSKNPNLGLPLGNRANLNLSGCYKTYVDNKKVRIVYKIIDDKIEIFVVAVGKRDDLEVYKKANDRL